MRAWLAGALLCLSLPLSSAERIVSLAPFLTEMVVLLESEARLVGVIDDQSLPETLETLPRVGAYQSLSLERIVVARPDVVLAWTSGNSAELLARLETLGIEVRRFDPQTLAQIDAMTVELGDLLGREELAAALSASFRSELERSAGRAGAQAPKVFVQLWDEPIFTVAGEQLLSDALRHCGADNLFHPLPGLAPQVSVEAVLAVQPEVIIALADQSERAQAWLDRWRAHERIPAVKHERLYALRSDTLVRPTPAIAQGVSTLCRLLAGSEGNTETGQVR